MSMKIYDCYKFNKPVSKLSEFIAELSTQYKENVVNDLLYKKDEEISISYVKNQVYEWNETEEEIIDYTKRNGLKIYKDKKISSFGWVSLSKVLENITEMKVVSFNLSDFDYYCTCVVYFYKKNIFIKFFARKILKNIIDLSKYIESGILSEFEYWDCTDRPSNISSKSWKYRRKVFDDLEQMFKKTTFAGMGFTYTFHDDLFKITSELQKRITND